MTDVSQPTRQSSQKEMQDAEYVFPYHYLPYFDDTGTGQRFRVLSWGLEYLSYMTRAAELACELAPTSILDVGCGDGRFCEMLSASQASYHGVDFNQSAIRYAKAFQPNGQFHLGDAISFNGTFELSVAIEVLEHVPDESLKSFVEQLWAFTRPGGHILISVPTIVAPTSPKHFRHYSLELLQEHMSLPGKPLTLIRHEYVCRRSLIARLYSRLTCNRFAFIEIALLSRLIWWYHKNHLRKATEKNGLHLVAIFQRESEE